jgi:hypothetical protein
MKEPKTVAECGGISEAELIEMEKRASAISIAEESLQKRISDCERNGQYIPYGWELDFERLQKVSDDFRQLVALARLPARRSRISKRTGAEVGSKSERELPGM